MGADFVIGVDLNAKHAFQTPENILDVILNSFHFVMQQTVALQIQSADVLIEPDLSSFSRSNMAHVNALMEKGYEDAKTALMEVEFPDKDNWLQSFLGNIKERLKN
jgi:NTE family protein